MSNVIWRRGRRGREGRKGEGKRGEKGRGRRGEERGGKGRRELLKSVSIRVELQLDKHRCLKVEGLGE